MTKSTRGSHFSFYTTDPGIQSAIDIEKQSPDREAIKSFPNRITEIRNFRVDRLRQNISHGNSQTFPASDADAKSIPDNSQSPTGFCITAQGCEATLGSPGKHKINPERVTQPLRGRFSFSFRITGVAVATPTCVAKSLWDTFCGDVGAPSGRFLLDTRFPELKSGFQCKIICVLKGHRNRAIHRPTPHTFPPLTTTAALLSPLFFQAA